MVSRRSESAGDAAPAEPAEDPHPWASPEEPVREMRAHIGEPPAEDRSPQFLFISRLSEEQITKASAEALDSARRNAEQLARLFQKRLGALGHVHQGVGGPEFLRPDRMMNRQRCAALLA